METGRSGLSWSRANLNSPFHTVILVCFVAALSYLAARIGGTLIIRPETVWPLWPDCVLLVFVLLLAPRRIWPILMAAAFGAFVLYDLQADVPIRSTAWLILADTLEVLIAAWSLSYFFKGVPQLNSVKDLAKYSAFAVILAPFAGAFVGALATSGNYWTSWRVSFFSEALAFLTLMPALLSWAIKVPAWAKKSGAYYLEAGVLIATFVLLGYITLVAPGRSNSPALLYSLVPFLLWAALRFGSMGISTSVILLAFLSIWGAVHGRGPFTEPEPINEVLSLQVFLFFTAAPFMVLAALVEERKQAEEQLREGEERLRLAVQAGMMYAFEWDMASDAIVRTGQCRDILNWMDDPMRDTGRQFLGRVHPDDREAYVTTETGCTLDNPSYQTSYRILCPDGGVVWLEESGRAFFDGKGKMLRIIGMVANVTEQKRAEEAISSVSRRLIEAHEEERTRIARDLHDDINQRLALVAVGLHEVEQLEQSPSRSVAEVCSYVHKLGQAISEIGTDVQAISHRLHSSKLEYMGLVPAARSFCNELSEQQKVEITFAHDEIPPTLPHEISLCLFRVLQEALQNAVKYSGVRHFNVELRDASGAIDLSVRDSGSGFEVEEAMKTHGLGLISMAERLKLVDGQLSIDSQPRRGTTIHARVPFRKIARAASQER
jgi:signal transduction histidine kinase/integral membrane sensor domain MASE1